jgi:hypothetical protein
MKLSAYREAGLPEFFDHAIIILKERGLTKGTIFNPKTGEVDVRGALFLAGGAKPATLLAEELNGIPLPEYWKPKVDAAIEMIEFLNGDLEQWCDNPATTIETVIAAFRKAKHMIQIAVT